MLDIALVRFVKPMHNPMLAAYTQLYCGLSKDIRTQANGSYVIFWDRIHSQLRRDLVEASKTKEDRRREFWKGSACQDFWEFCNGKTQEFAAHVFMAMSADPSMYSMRNIPVGKSINRLSLSDYFNFVGTLPLGWPIRGSLSSLET